MKKLLILTLILVFGLTACVDFGMEHTHTPIDGYQSNSESHWQNCSDCEDKVNLGNHSFDGGVVTTEATENSEGIMTYTCTVCGFTKTESIDKLNSDNLGESGDNTETPGEGGDTDSDNPGEGSGDTDSDNPGEGSGDTDSDNPGEGGGDTDSDNPGEGGGDTDSDNPGEGSGDTDSDNPGEGGGDTDSDNPGEGGGDTDSDNPGEGGGDTDSDNPGEGGGDTDSDNPGEGGGDTDSDHEHTFELGWTSDENGHYHKAVCCDHITKYEPHVVDEESTICECEICGYYGVHTVHEADSEWTSDETGHWHNSTCYHVYGPYKLDYVAHTYGDGVVTQPATDTSDGIMTYTCTICGYEYDEIIYIEGHQHSYREYYSYDSEYHWYESSCGHDVSEKFEHNFVKISIREFHTESNVIYARTEYNCSDCHYITVIDEVHEHTYSEWVVDAYSHSYYTTCTDHDRIDFSGSHKYGDGIVTLEPTLAANGSMSYTCSDCQYVNTVKIEHDHNYVSLGEYGCSDTVHWQIAECACGMTAEINTESHLVSDDGMCTVCGNYVDIFSSNMLSYTLSTDGTYYIVSGLNYTSSYDIRVPEYHLGLPVKEIGAGVFANISYSSVILNKNITVIGDGAFENSYVNIYEWDSVIEIGSNAFKNFSPYYGDFYIPESVRKIGASAFEGVCFTEYYALTIGSNIESIGDGAFYGATIHTLYYQLNTLKCDQLFANCKITYLYLVGCEAVEENAFSNMDIRYIASDESLKSIGDGAFSNIYPSDGYYVSLQLNGTDLVIGNGVFANTMICDFIMSGVKSIGNNSFTSFYSSSVYLPDGIESIGSGTFIPAMEKIYDIYIPASVTYIGEGSFASSTVQYYGEDYPKVTYVGTAEQWAGLDFISTEFWKHMYVYAEDGEIYPIHSYTYVYYGDSGTNYHCHLVQSECSIHEMFTDYEPCEFVPNGLSMECTKCGYSYTVDVHEHVYETSYDADGHWDESICLDHDTVTTNYEAHDFKYDYISGGYEYYHCTACGYVMSIQSDHEHTYSSEWKYDEYYHWHEADCGHNMNSAMEYHSLDLDGVCVCGYERAIFEFTVCDGGYELLSVYGSYYESDITVPVYNIPAYYNGLPVVSIGENAFAGIDRTCYIMMPDTVTVIKEYAFAKCDAVTLRLSCNLKTIGSYAFEGSYSLTELVIPDGVTELGECAIAYCMNLKSLYLPASLTSVGRQYGLYQLDATVCGEIHFGGTLEQWQSIAFSASDWELGGVKVICTDGEYTDGEQHEHIYDGSEGGYYYNYYFADSTYHWHVTSCSEHEPLIIDRAEHNFYTSKGDWGERTYCMSCQYEVSCHYHDYGSADRDSYKFDDEKHWLECECGAVSSVASHDPDSDGICMYCNHETELFVFFELSDGTYQITGFNRPFSETKLVIPSEYNGKPVTSLAVELGMMCYNLESIVIPEGITRLEYGTFRDCTLTSIVLPESIEYIGDYVFAYCYNLSELTIGANVKEISSMNFYSCYNLTTINYAGDMASWNELVTASGIIFDSSMPVIICSDGSVYAGGGNEDMYA